VPARYIPEPVLGLHNARHTGVKESKADLLFFTDDDATLSPDCLYAINNAFHQHPKMEAAGGPVRPIWEQPPPQWLVDYMEGRTSFGVLSLMEPYKEFRLSRDCYFFGVNMSVRRLIFQRTGFHPELIGTRTIGDGESGLKKEIIDSGGLIGYIPEAVVYHHIPPSRMTVTYIRKWAWHLGGAQMYQRWWKRKRDSMPIVKEIFLTLSQYWKKWLMAFFLIQRKGRKSIDVQFQSSLGLCKLTYIWWMITDRKVQAALDIRDFRP
jgi:GT2 family glycosyltransferase